MTYEITWLSFKIDFTKVTLCDIHTMLSWNVGQATQAENSSNNGLQRWATKAGQAHTITTRQACCIIWLVTSVAVLTETLLRSSRKIFIFVIKKYNYRIKVSKKTNNLVSEKSDSKPNLLNTKASYCVAYSNQLRHPKQIYNEYSYNLCFVVRVANKMTLGTHRNQMNA